MMKMRVPSGDCPETIAVLEHTPRPAAIRAAARRRPREHRAARSRGRWHPDNITFSKVCNNRAI
jgi:hypothetical protein